MNAWLVAALAEIHPLSVAVLALVTLQRLAELALARRNTRLLLAHGGVEVAPGHYPAMVALHSAWLAGLWLLAPSRAPDIALLAIFGLMQIGRGWVLASLGMRWTTRIIVVPGAHLVRSGPYRFFRHPNYLIVAGEILVLPLAFGLPLFAVLFSGLNALVLWVRLRAEDAALRGRTASGPGFTMTATRTSQAGAAVPSLRIWAAFAALCVGMFMAILDVQIVAASLPTIQTALALQPEQMSWVQTGYLIAEVVAIPLTGLLTRALTMRWLSVTTLVVFTIASIGCAWSGSLASLLAWRVVQGLAGGLLIPQVFAAAFVLFPDRSQALATTIAGMLAVLAPTVGPFIGGWITDTFGWPWLFLINVAPGVAAIATCASLLPREKAEVGLLRKLDPIALALMAVALACLEIGLKKAPQGGWISFDTAVLFATCLAAGSWFVARSIKAKHPVVELRALGDPGFALGCLLSFILGIGLYGAVYLMPVFLAFVRHHDAMEIGKIMMVTGAAQLVMAPVAVVLERYVSARWLTAAGFGLFAVGLAASAFQTRATDFEEMLIPQVIRGFAIMLCLLPPIRIALAHLPADAVPDASGVFNLMRNLGGAIGLALIDTVIYGRAPVIGERLGQALASGDVETAKAVGLPLDRFLAHTPGTPLEPAALAYVTGAVKRQATVEAVNEAWAMIALLALLGVVALCVASVRAPAVRRAWRPVG